MNKTGNIRKSFIRYAVIATVLTLAFLFIRSDNLIRWIQAGFTLRQQERKIEELKLKNEELDNTILMMTTDRDSLETFAREEFFFAAPGDDVYIVE